jgi:Arc/MetJ-type ribon-helix-helix transcriptional regulator
MSTQKMLNGFKELQANLNSDGRLDSRSHAVRGALKTLAKLYELQHGYAEAKKIDPSINVAFMEGATPLTEQELDNLKESKEIDRSIGKRLGAIRKAKKNATKK